MQSCSKTCASIHTGYKFVRSWHQRTGAGVWRWRSGSQSCPRPSLVHWPNTLLAQQTRELAQYSSPITRGSSMPEKVLTRPSHSGKVGSRGVMTWIVMRRGGGQIGPFFFQHERGSGLDNQRVAVPTETTWADWNVECECHCHTSFALPSIWSTTYLNFWHGIFISDFIAENLSISFFLTPCR